MTTNTATTTAAAAKPKASGRPNQVTILDVARATDKNGKPYARLTTHLRKQNGEMSMKDGAVREVTIMVFGEALPAYDSQLEVGSTIDMFVVCPDNGAVRAYVPKQAANDDAAAPAAVAA